MGNKGAIIRLLKMAAQYAEQARQELADHLGDPDADNVRHELTKVVHNLYWWAETLEK